MNVFVQIGVTKKWYTSKISEEQCQRWYIENGIVIKLEDVGNISIGEMEDSVVAIL